MITLHQHEVEDKPAYNWFGVIHYNNSLFVQCLLRYNEQMALIMSFLQWQCIKLSLCFSRDPQDLLESKDL